jgi:uncharacterized BrkB/YihY/UPF0761 family membrane protein
MATKEEWNEALRPYGYKIIKIWLFRILVILSMIGVLFLILGFLSVSINALDLSKFIPNFLRVEFTISPETLDIIKSYVNQTIQEIR